MLEKHGLHHEFPEYHDAIHALKMGDAHFLKLFNRYDELDHEINRIEQGVENTSDDYLEGIKFKRLRLKDELYGMLKKHATAGAA